MRRLVLVFLVALTAAGLTPPVHAADSGTDRRSYAAAVDQARALVEEARNGRPAAVGEALDSLHSVGADSDMPEIARDLKENPPDLADADRRLTAASAALARPGDVSDSSRAQRQLQDILAQERYSYLHKSPQNPIVAWLQSLLSTIVGWLSRQRVGTVPQLPEAPTWVWLTLLGVVVLGAAGVAFSQLRGVRLRLPGRRQPDDEPMPAAAVARHAEDRFSAADRLAAAGDRSAALRSLMAGVATEISGRPFWESSPLTVRELFRETGRLDDLRPLLLSFEGAVYGEQPVSAEAYAECARLAEPFRARHRQHRAAA